MPLAQREPQPPTTPPEPETRKPPAESPEGRPEEEQILDYFLETAIISAAEKINEGNNGIIFKLRTSALSPQLLEVLQTRGVELDNEYAIKVLKVYKKGSGELEAALQRRAHEITAQADPVSHAQVPKMHLFRDLHLSEEGREFLRNNGASDALQDDAEIIIMDLIPGEDLATTLYKETLKRRGFTEKDFGHLSFDDLERFLFDFGRLDLRLPGGKARDEGQREHERRITEADNINKLFSFLARAGYILEPAVAAQIENTIKLFRRNGLLWRDGHMRNIMLARQEDPAHAHTFIIDFGSSQFFDPDLENADELLEGRPQDLAVARLLKKYFSYNDRGGAYLQTLAKLRGRVESNAALMRQYESAKNAAGEGSATRALNLLFPHTFNLTQLDIFAVMTEKLVEEGAVTAEEVRNFVETKLDGMVGEPLKKLRQISGLYS